MIKVEIEVKAKAGSIQFQDKTTIEVDNVIEYPEVEICYDSEGEILLHAGPLEIIEFVILKSAPYAPPAANGSCMMKPGEEAKTPVYWFNDKGEKPEKLYRTLFLGKDVLAQAVGGDGKTQLEKLTVLNQITVPIKVSALVARKRPSISRDPQPAQPKVWNQR